MLNECKQGTWNCILIFKSFSCHKKTENFNISVSMRLSINQGLAASLNDFKYFDLNW